jgi:hypothetical protein
MYQLLGHQTGYLAGGPVRTSVLEGIVELPADAQPGVHEQLGHTLVVHTSPREAETDRCSPEDFTNRFGLKLGAEAATVAAPATARAGIGSELIDSEFWPWIAMGLLAALVLEGLVANRTAA